MRNVTTPQIQGGTFASDGARNSLQQLVQSLWPSGFLSCHNNSHQCVQVYITNRSPVLADRKEVRDGNLLNCSIFRTPPTENRPCA